MQESDNPFYPLDNFPANWETWAAKVVEVLYVEGWGKRKEVIRPLSHSHSHSASFAEPPKLSTQVVWRWIFSLAWLSLTVTVVGQVGLTAVGKTRAKEKIWIQVVPFGGKTWTVDTAHRKHTKIQWKNQNTQRSSQQKRKTQKHNEVHRRGKKEWGLYGISHFHF